MIAYFQKLRGKEVHQQLPKLCPIHIKYKMIQSVVESLYQKIKMDREQGTPISKLCSLNMMEIQPIVSEHFNTLKAIFKEISSRMGTNRFSTDDRNDFTLYLGCLLKLQIYPTPDILEFFVSHRLVPIDSGELRTNYYNYRKNKKMTELQDILNITTKEIQNEYQRSTQCQDSQQQKFVQFYFAWIAYLTGTNNKLVQMCNDVLVAFESNEDMITQDKKLQEIIEIKNLEKLINQKMSQQNRMELIQPKDDQHSARRSMLAQQKLKQIDVFNPIYYYPNQESEQLALYTPTQPYMKTARVQETGGALYQDLFPQNQQKLYTFPPVQQQQAYMGISQPNYAVPHYQTYQVVTQPYYPQQQYSHPQMPMGASHANMNLSNIFNIFGKDPEPVTQQQGNTTQEFSLLSDFNGLTTQTRTDPINNFMNINKPVITEKENGDEVSSALVHLALGEKSEQEDSKAREKNLPSLFSSFM